MLNKKLQSHIDNMEAYSKMFSAEVQKVKMLLADEKEKEVKIDNTAVNFHKRRTQQMKKSLAIN